jgi:AcrR family transcriptional regulator
MRVNGIARQPTRVGQAPQPGLATVDCRRNLRARNRERIIIAASDLFAQRGYRGTATRDIADAAGVAERTLFRHFPSKAALFRDAVITPVQTFVQDFSSGWEKRERGGRDTEVEVLEFFSTLIGVVAGERKLLVALAAAITFEDPESELYPELQTTLVPLLEGLERIFEVEAAARGWQVDSEIGVRVIVGMALGVTVHSEWLFAGRSQPSTRSLVEQLTTITTWGLTGPRR